MTLSSYLGNRCWKCYRKLQNATYNVRYLGLARARPLEIAVQYYSRDDAQRMYSTDLAIVREEVKASLRK